MTEGRTTWRFPRSFWTGNAAELCERAAYYGTFIALRTYLIRAVGLDDVQAGIVAGMFGGWIFGFIFSGFLLSRYCPEPTTLPLELQLQHAAALAGQGPMPEAYANAHYLWLAYTGVGILTLLALLLFIWATRRIDARVAG